MPGKTSEKTSYVEDRSRAKHAEIKIAPQENFNRARWIRKAKSKSYRETKGQRRKKGVKQKQPKKVKSVLKMSIPTELVNTSNELKKHAAKLTEAKKRLKERNAIKYEKKKRSSVEMKRIDSHKYANQRDLVVSKKKTEKNAVKSKKNTNKTEMNSKKEHKITTARKNEKFRS